MAAAEAESEQLKRALTAQFKVFSDQIDWLHELIDSFHSQHQYDPITSSAPSSRLLPAIETTSFEQALLPYLNRNQGMKKDSASDVLRVFQTIPSKVEMSTYQRECIALAIGVLRNTDNVQDLTQLSSLGGGDLLCRWMRVRVIDSLPLYINMYLICWFL